MDPNLIHNVGDRYRDRDQRLFFASLKQLPDFHWHQTEKGENENLAVGKGCFTAWFLFALLSEKVLL